ncbi:MAG: hypothetical protein JSR51_06645 [Proteobacteria bacterium]|nr:hypothetical protein [Pseudomonadota bacterium]
MDVAEYYRKLLQHSGDVLENMLQDTDAIEALTASQNYLLDYDLLKSAIAGRPEIDAFDAAVKEYQFALFALATGQYRHAFVGLRLFFELMLATVQFSAHEIDYRMWAKDSKDINWSALKDPQSGIFSANFINAFNPEFSENSKQYSAIAEAVYRECSEFVHGNASTHTSLPSEISFNKAAFISWNQKAEIMRMLIIFIFSARYLNYIENEAMDMLEPIVLDAIGQLPAVQAIFSKPSQD